MYLSIYITEALLASAVRLWYRGSWNSEEEKNNNTQKISERRHRAHKTEWYGRCEIATLGPICCTDLN